jgi:hypothetical protein
LNYTKYLTNIETDDEAVINYPDRTGNNVGTSTYDYLCGDRNGRSWQGALVLLNESMRNYSRTNDIRKPEAHQQKSWNPKSTEESCEENCAGLTSPADCPCPDRKYGCTWNNMNDRQIEEYERLTLGEKHASIDQH